MTIISMVPICCNESNIKKVLTSFYISIDPLIKTVKDLKIHADWHTRTDTQ